MNTDSIEDNVRNVIHDNPRIVAKSLAIVFIIFGILAIIGAIRNWDWLYKPDDQYHNWYTMGQVSRYLGRNTARVIGFIGGIMISCAGAYWLYYMMFRK
jgi:Immunity protein 17